MPGQSAPNRPASIASLHKREVRLQTFAVYGALCFMALIVIATLPHRIF